MRDFLGAQEQTASLMERKQRLAMAQEQQDQRSMEFIAKLPAIRANAELDVANARAAIKLSADNSIQETKAAQAWEEPNGYNERFQNILRGIPDPKEQSDALQALQGEVAWTKQFKAYAPGVDAVNNARASAVTLALTNLKLEQALEQNTMLVQGRRDVAEVNAGAKAANAQTYTQSRERIAALNADTRLTVEDKRAQRTAIQVESLQQSAIEADQMAADAQRDGDARTADNYRKNAAALRDMIEKTTTFAGTGQSAPRTAAQDPKATPKTTFTLPPLTLGGKPLATGDSAPMREAVQQAVAKPAKGTRAKQGGIWYQFDGSTWNAEKP